MMELERRYAFNSFAILDLETANLPHLNGNKVGITEITIYGVAKEEFNKETGGGILEELPRVVHKLTLMINPRMAIALSAERVTGLCNEMLEFESSFNVNAANAVLSFLNHLRQPICLVAHNGYAFDFPIIKRVLEKVEMTMPDTVYCIDSLRAFHDIDLENVEKRSNFETSDIDRTKAQISEESVNEENILVAEKIFDARAQNETTPKRPTLNTVVASMKRRRDSFADDDDQSNDEKCQESENNPPKSKRALNFGESPISSTKMSYLTPEGRKWYPPKGKYKLGIIYERLFKQTSQQHHAEADVIMLTKLMLHYGKDFVDYAENYARQFNSIPRLGRNI